MNKQEFIRNNDLAVNRLAGLIVLIVILVVFPLMTLLTVLGIFHIPYTFLALTSGISILLIIPTYILAVRRASPSLVKYALVIISTAVVATLATNVNIGINLTYLFPCILSCLYYDKRVTWTAFGIGTISILYTQYLRFFALDPTATLGTFLPKAAGNIFEFFALFMIFNLLINRITKLFSEVLSGEERKICWNP